MSPQLFWLLCCPFLFYLAYPIIVSRISYHCFTHIFTSAFAFPFSPCSGSHKGSSFKGRKHSFDDDEEEEKQKEKEKSKKEKESGEETEEEEDEEAKKKKAEEEEEEEEKEKVPPTTLSHILSYSKPEWPYIVLGCISSAVSGVAFPLFAVLLSKMMAIYTTSCQRDQ